MKQPSLASCPPRERIFCISTTYSLAPELIVTTAGGNARDALRSLVISQQLLGTQEIILVKHTGCGMLTFQNKDALDITTRNLGADAAKEAKAAFGADFQPFPDLEKAVAADVEFLKG